MKRVQFLSEFAAVQPHEGRRRDMVIYAGSPVYRFDLWSGKEYMLTLSTDPKHVNIARLQNAPVTVNHDRRVESTIGVLERAWLEDGQVRGIALFAETPGSEETWAKIEQGILRNLSVEVKFNSDPRDVTPKGSKVKQFLAEDWEPQAVSVVPVGADPKATFLSDDAAPDMWLPEQQYLALAGVNRPADDLERDTLLVKLAIRRNANASRRFTDEKGPTQT